jgi:hypothetical protein
MFKPTTGSPVCETIDTEIFFLPDKPGVTRYPPVLSSICASCEVKVECLEYALKWDVQGWWGGTSESDRRHLRNSLGIEPQSILMPQLQKGGYHYHQRKDDDMSEPQWLEGDPIALDTDIDYDDECRMCESVKCKCDDELS